MCYGKHTLGWDPLVRIFCLQFCHNWLIFFSKMSLCSINQIFALENKLSKSLLWINLSHLIVNSSSPTHKMFSKKHRLILWHKFFLLFYKSFTFSLSLCIVRTLKHIWFLHTINKFSKSLVFCECVYRSLLWQRHRQIERKRCILLFFGTVRQINKLTQMRIASLSSCIQATANAKTFDKYDRHMEKCLRFNSISAFVMRCSSEKNHLFYLKKVFGSLAFMWTFHRRYFNNLSFRYLFG